LKDVFGGCFIEKNNKFKFFVFFSPKYEKNFSQKKNYPHFSKRMALRPHQIHAINGIADHPLCAVNHFCGTGKTHIMKALLEMMTIGEVAILVFPSLALIHQFHLDYATQLQQFKWLTVCSEKQDVGFFLPHTTQLNTIIDFLKLEDSRVLTVTYDSLSIILSAISPTFIDDENENELSDEDNITYEPESLETSIIVRYLLFDEAHHVTEKRNRNLLWKDNEWQVSNVTQTIFFTASLRNKSGIIMDPEQSSRINTAWEKYGILPQQDEDEDILEGHCGPVVSRYTHRQAVLDGNCNDFALRCDFGISRLNICREQIVLESILRAMITNHQSRALTFHSSIVKGVNIYTNELLMAAWTYLGKPDGFATPEIIHLNASTQDRPKLLAKFEAVPDHCEGNINRLVILASCRTIGEGIDTKRAQLVAFADPKSSQIDILQNIGRVCRAYDGMRVATVLIPVVVNKEKYMEVQDDDVKRDALIREDLNKGGDFNAILRVSSALRQYDPDLYNLCWSFPKCFSSVEVKENLLRQNCSTINDNDNSDQKSHVVKANEILQKYQGATDANIAMTKFSDEIGKAVEVHSTSMENPIQFFGNGELDPVIVVYDEKQSRYELLQKNIKKKLDPPKRRLVQVHMDSETMVLWNTTDTLDFVAKNTQTATLDSEIRFVSWETRLASFVQFLSKNGKYPYSKSKDSTERTIGYWVCTQRANKDMMPSERKSQLDKIEFVWETDLWPEILQDFVDWMLEKNGKYPSSRSEDRREKKLGGWVAAQRANKNKMTIDRTTKLDKIGFIWEVDVWPDNLQDLVRWLSENGGKYPVYDSKDFKEKKLHSWVCTQRTNKNKMNSDRKTKLDEIGFIWDVDIWPDKLEELVQWLSKNDAKYPSSKSKDTTERTLAGWVLTQRRQKIKMSANRKANLDKMLFIWEVDTWPDKFQHLVQWLLKNDGKYPSKSKDPTEKTLGYWVSDQRKNKESLPPDRKEKLDKMGFVWMVDTWSDKFQDLVRWLSNNGGKYPSSTSKDFIEKRLGFWVLHQRKDKNKMHVDRKARLDKNGFVWVVDTWPDKLQELVIWLSKNDKYPSKNSKDITEKILGCWVSVQRKSKDKMSPDRKAKLDKTGFIWSIGKTKYYSNSSISSYQSSFILPNWFVLCSNIVKLLIGSINMSQSSLLQYLKGDEHEAYQVFQVYGSTNFKSALTTMLQDIKSTKFTKKLIDPLICESRLNCDDCGEETVSQLHIIPDQIMNSFSMDTTCNICKKPSKQELVKLGVRCLVLCDLESNLELPSLFLFKNVRYSRVCAIEESKSEEWSRTTTPNFINKMIHCVVYDREKHEKKSNDVAKQNEEKDSTKTFDSVPIIFDCVITTSSAEKSQIISSNISILAIDQPESSSNKRKAIRDDKTIKKKPRTLLSQLQVEKDKIAQKQQILKEAERLFNLQNPTKDEEQNLELLKRQLGLFDDTYNEANHDEKHRTWKQSMNMVFTELVSDFTCIGDNILYLDCEQQHTTTTLRSCFGNSRKLYVANWSQETSDNLKKSGTIDEIQHGSIKNLLEGHWQSEIFAASYLDLCCGSGSTISEVLKSLLHSGHKTKIVGFTMTQRDPEGYNQVERLDRLESDLRCLCCKMTRVADFPKFKDTIWIDGGVVTRFYVIG
jgi:superfamily II DNA or RNA helicase